MAAAFASTASNNSQKLLNTIKENLLMHNDEGFKNQDLHIAAIFLHLLRSLVRFSILKTIFAITMSQANLHFQLIFSCRVTMGDYN